MNKMVKVCFRISEISVFHALVTKAKEMKDLLLQISITDNKGQGSDLQKVSKETTDRTSN